MESGDLVEFWKMKKMSYINYVYQLAELHVYHGHCTIWKLYCRYISCISQVLLYNKQLQNLSCI